MRKNGRDRYGRQRWQCSHCQLTSGFREGGKSVRAQLSAFLTWLLEEGRQGEKPSAARAFRRRTSWCWSLQPYIVPDGLPHPVVMADGTYVGREHCLLVCCDGITGHVLAWRWCESENARDYMALFDQITRLYRQPLLLVSDGMRGLPTAVQTAWPGCRSQRCLEHVRRDCRTDLALHPQTPAGRELKEITRMLATVGERQAARKMLVALGSWYERWRVWVGEKSTYISEATGRPYKDWTHKRVRRCFTRLARLSHNGELSCFLDPTLVQACGVKVLPCTSNMLEGGINSPIKNMLRAHRGMPEAHMMRACEWMCWKHSGRPLPRIKDMLQRPKPTSPEGDADYLPGWGTGIQWSDFHTQTRYPDSAQ